jgi:hypothetical protein
VISVFADYAGEIKNNKERVIVLATLIASDTQIGKINRYCGDLKDTVAQWDVDTSQEQFEFKTYEILQGSGIWRGLSEAKRFKVAKKLRRAIWDSGVHFAMVLVDKNDGGLEGIARFNEFVRSMRDKTLTIIDEEQKQVVQEWLDKKLPEKKGLGRLGTMTGLLFGLTTGLIHAKNLGDSAGVIIDDQFVKEVGAWEVIFLAQEVSWPLISTLKLFHGWPRNNQPNWYLGSTLDTTDSRDSYGIQLADFIAYTTRRINEKAGSIADQLSVVSDCLAFRLGDYQGIHLITSYKVRHGPTYPRKIKRRW